ncbi:unnamed protein product [Plutella xylostella]|uniref:(diamondback moth) hypothetical protein n=1 Tax=Plutella xylostella TaxID=51655 RepID=A0A8S4FJT9_PLUXY|nr:unnamed protein product [Plutella xylostella]
MTTTATTTATRHVKTSNSANIMMCKQWWRVCWLHGDQEKYYRQLYGRRKMTHTNTINFDLTDTKRSGARITELTDDFLDQNNTPTAPADIEPAPDEIDKTKLKKTTVTFGVESEPIYGFNEFQSSWQRDQRRQPIQRDYEDIINSTNLDDIWGSSLNADNIKSMLENGLPLAENLGSSRSRPEILDSKEQIHKNGNTFGKTSKMVCRTRKGAIVTEETDISTDGRTTAALKFQRSSVQSGPNRGLVPRGGRELAGAGAGGRGRGAARGTASPPPPPRSSPSRRPQSPSAMREYCCNLY